jgi:hypothetical protein
MGATEIVLFPYFIEILVFPMTGIKVSSRSFPQTSPISRLPCYRLLQMASILKLGTTWRAQVRRKGHKSISETFATKAQAQAWARQIEAQMDARRFDDVRGLANLTLKELIDWYVDVVGGTQPFGRNKRAVLNMWQRDHGDTRLSELTTHYLTNFIRTRRAGGTSGITINIDLTYLGGVLKCRRAISRGCR